MDASAEGELQVSKCKCETGRKRHRIPRSAQIPFEITGIAPVQDEVDNDDFALNLLEDEEPLVNPMNLTFADMFMNMNVPLNFPNIIAPALGMDQNILAQILAAGVMNGDDNDDDNDDDSDSDSGDSDDGFDDDGDDLDLTLMNLLFPGTFETEEEDDQGSPPLPLEGDDVSEEEAEEQDQLPQIALWRLNLNALSQVYNIYMVAYTNRVYVCRPRSCITNAVPGQPDLVLRPRPSAMSYRVGGYMDENFPHQINHVVVGNLGDEEILLLAYDDGDVIAYYTRHLENELSRREREGQSNRATPQPFFRENVGKSAWGLAVHKKSRIIAVSSNLHNVSVFVFALTGQHYRHAPQADSVELFRNVVKNENGELVDSENHSSQAANDDAYAAKIGNLEHAIRRRDANWRIILQTGRGGTNIPNIAFSENGGGDAEAIVAVDIDGRLWVMDIWHFSDHPHVKIEPIHHPRPHSLPHGRNNHRPKGWGVLVLPESSFFPAKNYPDALGLPLSQVNHVASKRIGRWVDISAGINNLKNNSKVHPWVRSGNTNRFVINPLEPRRADLEIPWYDPGTISTIGSLLSPVGGNSTSHSGRESRLGRRNSVNMSRAKKFLRCGSNILRTYEVDIELRSFEEDGIGIMFEKAIDQARPSHAVLPTINTSHSRLANLIHVPELSLVVAGSLCGRVALITLTRPKEKNMSLQRCFKIEAILPTKQDEDRQVRPICPLLGVAVSPVPFSGKLEQAEKPIGPRRYRIMLHYYDLRILSYEISRSSEMDPITIV
ncbi:hypothetical protein F4677DRAFT_447783 [Hypoxylon crocopeplum]|nr:hypothetical protein F4677DRAFT_447783 [Hypoxylon crocopeplum]